MDKAASCSDPELAPLFGALAERLALGLGLHFPRERWGDLERAVRAVAAELACPDLRSCLERLLADRFMPDFLAHHLTIGETYFFRDPQVFAALRTLFLPQLALQRRNRERRLRIWSAGCCTGEEPYSIAMLLADNLHDLARWDITLLATDLNRRFLALASTGVYGEWSFRDIAQDIKPRWFIPTGDGRYRVDRRLQAMVDFAPLNLVEDVYPSAATDTLAMDLIVCRNVLMYFRPEQVRAVTARLARCLVPGGWLIVSPVEVRLVSAPGLELLRLPNLMVFRKSAAVPLAVAPPPAALRPSAPRQAEAVPEKRQAPEQAADLAGQARTLADQGRLPEALAWCERAVAADRLDPASTYLHASILLEQGDTGAATAALKRTLYIDHEHLPAILSLAGLLAGQGLQREARRHFRHALELLDRMPPDCVLPGSDGMAAGRMKATVASILGEEEQA